MRFCRRPTSRHFLPLALVVLVACGRIGFDGSSSDAAPDASTTPSARVVSTAYWTNYFGPTFGTTGMSVTGYSIDTLGVSDGELLLLVACIDNGSPTVWPDPLGPGFTQLSQLRWGADGQTCVVASKIAAGEPAAYTGTYGPGIVSASAVMVLLAIDHASAITDAAFTSGGGSDINPVPIQSPGVDVTVPHSLVLYAAGSDWNCFEVTDLTHTIPTGFSPLFWLTDQGNTTTKDWTAFQIDIREAEPGATGPIESVQTSTSTCAATPWTAALAIAPAP